MATTAPETVNSANWDVPLVDLQPIHEGLRDELRAAFERVLRSGRFASGEEVERFEVALAQRLGVAHAVGVASGTAALFLSLLAAGIGPGDEVVVPGNTFFATVETVLAVGATPVFADVDRASATLDPASVLSVLSARTAAVIAVHLYGHVVDVDALRTLADRWDILLLEDAAQAMGGRWGESWVGALGDAAGFSFYPTKNLGALGEGGAVTTNDTALADGVKALRSHGEREKNVHAVCGYNERLHELQAAFLQVKLAHLDAALEQRHQVVLRYLELLAPVEGVEPMAWLAGTSPAHHLMVVRVPERDRVLAHLERERIGAGVHYPTPVHLQPACGHLGGRRGQLPVVEELADSVLSLPLYVGLSDAEVERCVRVLAEAVGAR